MGDSVERTRAIVLWTALVAAGALLIAAVIGLSTGAFRVGRAGAQGRYEISEHRTVPLGEIAAVRINSVSAAIRVRDAADDHFEVHFTGTETTSDPTALPRLEAAVSGRALDIRIDRPKKLLLGLHGSDLLLDVAVPSRFAGSLSAESVSGTIDAVPHSYSAFSARTTSGAINLESLQSDSFEVHSVSGSVRGTGIAAGKVAVATTSGSVILETSAPAIDLHSVSGGLEASSSSPPSRVNAGTTSGAITLRFPADSSFALDARSVSGSIRCDYPIVMSGTGTGRNQLVGSVGSAQGGEVMVRTTSGSVLVTK